MEIRKVVVKKKRLRAFIERLGLICDLTGKFSSKSGKYAGYKTISTNRELYAKEDYSVMNFHFTKH